MKSVFRALVALIFALTLSSALWAQWSSDPSQNLDLSNISGADQVQPKPLPMPDNTWYVSWFNNNPNDPPPNGYDVYLQRLDANGYEQWQHDGIQVAKLTLSSTEDYGLSADTSGNALLAFQDDRKDPDNPQITAAKVSPSGTLLWGASGVSMTWDQGFHADPKIAGTTDGGIVVGWTTDSYIVLQKLDASGHPQWVGTTALNSGVVLSESAYNYTLADMHASDNGSVIVSFVRNHGFGSNNYLYANKISSTGQLLWGSGHVHVFDGGSLQFGEFPYFISDGAGGAVFSWYTNSPSLQVYAQHILANGTEAFPHNGSVGSTDSLNVRVDPSVGYRASTGETFLFWTEQDSLQDMSGVSGQKFDSSGNRLWGSDGVTILPLGSDSQEFVQTVQIGDGALVYWYDSPLYDAGTIQAIRLDTNGATVCSQFGVSTASAGKSRLMAGLAPSGLSALAWEDDRNGENDIFIQNVNPDCTLGIEDARLVHRK